MQLQLAKAEQVVGDWGIGRRQLAYWVDAGLIQARRVGAGKGSMKIFTTESLLDAYLASHLTQELAPERVWVALEEARKHYDYWLLAKPNKVMFEISSGTSAAECVVSVAVPIQTAIATIWILHKAPEEISTIQRGRPRKDWRLDFQENLAKIGEALRAEASSRPSIEEDIRAYRRERNSRLRETRVTVSP